MELGDEGNRMKFVSVAEQFLSDAELWAQLLDCTVTCT